MITRTIPNGSSRAILKHFLPMPIRWQQETEPSDVDGGVDFPMDENP